MIFDPRIHGCRSIRLDGYDYSQSGVYFVTIGAHARRCILGSIANHDVKLSEVGVIADEHWRRSSDLRREIMIDSYVVMPNHLHAIVGIDRDLDFESAPGSPRGPAKQSLASLVAGYKSAVTREARKFGQCGPLWQRGYYERIVRDNDELEAIRSYIADNPRQWIEDDENPEAARGAIAGRPYK